MAAGLAADYLEFLNEKFMSEFKEAKEEFGVELPLLPHFEEIEKVLQEKSISPSTPIAMRNWLYTLKFALADCIMFAEKEREHKAQNKKSHLDALSVKKLWFFYKTERKLLQIKKKLQSMKDVDAEAEASLMTDSVTVCSVWKRRGKFAFQIYGFDEQLLKIKSFILEEPHFSDHIKTVGIVGMRGVGKTTLAYSFVNYEAWEVFSPIIWVTLSEKIMNPSEIVRRLLKTLHDNDNDNDDIQAVNDDDDDLAVQHRELHDRLSGKKYLIVLDSVWHVSEWYSDLGTVSSNHPICFHNLSDSLPKGCGGAVIVTGSEDVAISTVGEKNLVRLEPTFDAEVLWSIFMDSVRRKTFLTSDHHQRLSKMKDEIIDRCDGLPLAAKSLAEIISLQLANKEYWSDSSVPKRFSLRFNQPYDDDDITELVGGLPGVYQVVHGSNCDEITVTGTCDPVAIARELGKFWQVELTSITTSKRYNGRATAQALKWLKFITKTDGGPGWPVVEKQFNELTASTDGLLHRSLFRKCIETNRESQEFAGELFDALARRLFDALARRQKIVDHSINKAQLKNFWDQMSDQSFDSRLQTFFDMVDKDADGRITEEEVREIISFSASANKLTNIQKQAGEYSALIMEELDPENHGYIMIEKLEMLLLQAPNHSAIGESQNLSQTLIQKLKPTWENNPLKRCYQDFKYFLQDNWQRAWVLALWIGVMLGLFAYKFVQYRNRAAYEVMGHCVCMAKGAAETLKLNMALILLPVCRNTITWLRNKTKLGVAVPFDDNLNFHTVIAVAIAIGVGIHGIYHLACDFPRLLDLDHKKYDELMKQYFGEVQPSSYWFFLKGVEGVTGIVMVVLMAIAFALGSPWLRQGKLNLPKPLKKVTGFNAFWYSHHLFIIVYTLLIVHGIKLYLIHDPYKKTTWMYLAVPITLYAGERLIRAFRSSIKAVKILKVAGYPGNVLAIHMLKPHGFKYKSGQYMFVNCAAVSPFEWHPLSITSAPGEDYLCFHIRTLGDWTRQLRNVFTRVCQPPSNLLGEREYNPNFPRMLIDGPYGAPTEDYKKYKVVLLVGLGIEATPMISIVKDIVHNMKAMEVEENDLENGVAGGGNNTPPISSSPMTQKQKAGSAGSSGSNFETRRAYFYWVMREQGSLDWFKELMNEVAEMDHKGVIEMHNYCTSVYGEGDTRSALIAMLQSLNHAKNGVDVVSDTRVTSHFAKPSWRNVYKHVALNHTGAKIGVFYCGAPVLTQELRRLASDFSHKTSTKFEFHKENF